MSRGQDVVSLTPPSSGGPLRIVADGLLFFLILTGLLFSVCSVYGLEPDGAALLGVCVLLSALTLLVYSLPRRRWVAMLLLACLYAWLSWRYQDALVAGACVAADRVLSVLDISLQVSLVWMTGGSGELLWFLAMAAALLCVPLGWAVIRGRSAVLTLVLTLPWLLPAMLVELLPDWLPLMALAAGWCVLLLSGLCGREDAAGGARFSLICLPAVAALLLAISLLLPQGQYNRPAWTDSARAALANTALEFLGSGGPLSSVASLMTGGDQVSVRLDDAGPRTFQDRVVLEVESDYTGRLYLRGTSAGVYTGEAWEPLSDVAYAAIGLSESSVRDVLNGYHPLNFPAMTASGQPYYEMTVSYPSSLSGWMYTPYQLLTTQAEISDVTFRDDSYLERRFGIRTKNLYFIPTALPEQEMRSLPWDAAEAEARYRSFVYDQYLELPDGFEETFGAWFERMAAEGLEMDSLLRSATESYRNSPYRNQLTWASLMAMLLDISTEYDLNTDYTPEGVDFVDYFLNESARGYCVHYASAGTLMMRFLGIPARYVTGYTVDVPASGRAEVLDSDAHAWVEIYLDGYGWYPVEMTPAAGTGITSQAPMLPESAAPVETPEEPDEEDPAPETEEPPADPETPPEEEPEANDPEAPPETETQMPGAPGAEGDAAEAQGSAAWLRWLAAVVLLAAAVPVRALACGLLRRRRFRGTDTNRAVIAIYGWLERLRPWGADPDAVLGDAARKARFSQHRLSEEERRAALAAAAAERARIDAGLPRWRRGLLRWVRGL